MKTSIVLTGVGGHGVITATTILGKAAVNAGVQVYASEVHGMAQRGGSVYCTVRMGDVSSPLIASGTADVIVSTEPIEALRYIQYANKKTKVITDTNPVVPFTVNVGGESYPSLDEVYADISKNAELITLDALQIAKDAGARITKNIVLLGAVAATGVLPFDTEVLLETILANVPSKFKTINEHAFRGGMNAVTKK
ncbi:MAG: indolepyruvate oxidoreductase subunit beta [Candidatus Thermoplasmatota archaeon]|nr:indolepyruvate oxidoreductase subunit beta [Candidatus Thermoplasmatota archaeon]